MINRRRDFRRVNSRFFGGMIAEPVRDLCRDAAAKSLAVETVSSAWRVRAFARSCFSRNNSAQSITSLPVIVWLAVNREFVHNLHVRPVPKSLAARYLVYINLRWLVK